MESFNLICQVIFELKTKQPKWWLYKNEGVLDKIDVVFWLYFILNYYMGISKQRLSMCVC